MTQETTIEIRPAKDLQGSVEIYINGQFDDFGHDPIMVGARLMQLLSGTIDRIVLRDKESFVLNCKLVENKQ